MTSGRAIALGSRWAGVLSALVLVSTPVSGQGSSQPAELPPASYKGQQYVDTKGCVFLRAGTDGETVWVPRVTPGGSQICGYPPSGNRVPVLGEAGADEGPYALSESEADSAGAGEDEAAPSKSASAPVEAEEAQDTRSFAVAIGSFGFASNVNKAAKAAEALGFPVLKGQIKGGEAGLTTVFAGPFEGKAAAEKALKALHAAGFPDAMLMEF